MEKKIIYGGIVGGITFFVLGWLFYGLLMKDYFAAQVTVPGIYKEMPDFPLLLLGNFAQSFLLAILLGKWKNVQSVGEGFKSGLLVGVLMASGFDLIMYSTTTLMTMPGTIADIVVSSIMVSVVAAIQSMVMLRSSR